MTNDKQRAHNLKRDSMKKPEIYNYHDYKEFIKDCIEYAKVEHGLSQKKVAETSNVSAALLSMILSGERTISEEVIDKLSYVFKLTTSEKNFLNHLRVLTDSNSLEDRKNAVKSMAGFKKYKGKNDDEVINYSYLSKWYNVAIRELTECKDFKNDPDWIFERLQFKVSKKKIRESLKFLIDNDFLKLNENNDLTQTERSLVCNKEIYRLGLTEAHKQMFELATLSIKKVPREKRWLIGKALPISKDQYDEVITILNDAFDKIEKIKNDKSTNESVYQISIAAFPLALNSGEKK